MYTCQCMYMYMYVTSLMLAFDINELPKLDKGRGVILVKGAQSITGDKGIELVLILHAVALVIIVAGPGRISLSQVIKKIPRFIH